jgi:hypothetical protein
MLKLDSTWSLSSVDQIVVVQNWFAELASPGLSGQR